MATKPTSKGESAGAEASTTTAGKTGAKGVGLPTMFPMPDPKQLAAFAKALTPEQAFQLYRQNAKLALDVIDAALESTAKVRRLQFEGEEKARAMQKKVTRHAAEADDPKALIAAGQTVSKEAVEQAMVYWGQMFELVVDVQKRLFTLMQDQMTGLPGAKEAKAAMGLLPDLRQTQNLISALQGVMTSGGSAFESMQRVVGDFAKMMPGTKR
jgi:phasin family protein